MSTTTPKKLKDLAVGRRDLFFLSLDDIELEEGFNLRQSYETPEDLALRTYIRAGGELPPLVGSKVGEKFRVTDGHRRVVQCQILRDTVDDDPGCHWMRLSCLPESTQRKITEAERIARMLSANQGKPFTMWEQAQGYRRYRDAVIGDPLLSTHDRMAAMFGCTRTHVEDCLLLVDAGSADLQHAIASDKISATLAVKLIRRTDGHDEQNAALSMAQRNAKESGDGNRVTEKHFGDALKPKPKAPKKKAEAPNPTDPPNPTNPTDQTANTSSNAYAYDSSQEGEYEVTDPEVERELCDTCQKPLSETQLEAGDTTCWRCQKTSEVQPDDTGSQPSPPASGGNSGGGGGDPQPSPAAPQRKWEPPTTLDMPFFQNLVEDTKPLSNDRRQTMAYLYAHLEGQITRGHLVQWIREGRIDP